MEARGTTEEMRGYLSQAAVAGMNMLATLAEGNEELADLRASFLRAADVWAHEDAVPLRQLEQPLRGR